MHYLALNCSLMKESIPHEREDKLYKLIMFVSRLLVQNNRKVIETVEEIQDDSLEYFDDLNVESMRGADASCHSTYFSSILLVLHIITIHSIFD